MDDALGFWTALLLALSLTAWRTVLWRPRRLPEVTRPRPHLLGHRGVVGALPENTIAAFRMALEAGLDGVECDVQRTRDGALVLFHDIRVGSRRVVDMSLQELRRVEPQAPLLKELLELVARYPGTLLNVELKVEGPRGKGLEAEVARLVRAHRLEARTIVSSFNPLALARLRLVDPGLRVALLHAPNLRRGLRSGWLGPWLHVDAFHPHFSQVDASMVARLHARGAAVNTWNVNDGDEVRRLVGLGVDGIIADDPEALKRAAGRGGG